MASTKKSVPENKSKETKKNKNATKETKKKKASSSSSVKRKNDKTKTCNGTLNKHEEEVPASLSSSSDSQLEVENGVEITQNGTTTPKSKNNKQKGKREREKESVEKEDAKMNRFPMDRIRRIIRSEDSDMRITNEAVFLVNKATEKFLEKFCGESYVSAVNDRKKSLAYKHVASVVSKRKRYDFLSDFVPEKVKAEDALAERKLLEPEAT